MENLKQIILNKEGLEKYYHDYLTSNRKNKEMARLRKIQYKIDLEFIKKYIQKGKVLDVGCSGGFFLNELVYLLAISCRFC